jgi:hypothetical protein
MTAAKRKTSGGRVTPKGTRPPQAKSKAKAARPDDVSSSDDSTGEVNERKSLADERPRGGGANRPSVPRSAGRTGLRGGR